ncbi:hypothetical protein FXB66_02415 [Aggregatibacter actinomycetemcomitans]|uniref:Uncharacterized protein n=1 Tax=Aggregatibacter actinomycetemcomitans TaxID=714 RepID=A0AB74N7F0_AGGAC|nr:hypothetical protein RO04_09860 [Aggregatibacter actinomycetemcomitans]PHO21113.1 hypothetical protein CQR80_02825 [Aggregatibacter actinomycetemcomitans]PHO23335.1 hypothetical protein CQR79_03065 [Aggregatibacter actinomycetemcomitans]TYA16166.1 hypothetical protein FXE10_05760 [Aggregatibacter actinomycetemcomitans]TYA21960.1 hypothetical protein FXE08_02145 [Aggregatibacter actinomycetemcomitans]
MAQFLRRIIGVFYHCDFIVHLVLLRQVLLWHNVITPPAMARRKRRNRKKVINPYYLSLPA